MRSLFDIDSPLMNGLGKIFDCIMLSVCWVLACLPIVTVGDACGALYRTVYRCIRGDEGYPLKVFLETFRKNLKHSILTWLPVLGVFLFLYLDAILLKGQISVGKPLARLYGVILVLIGVWAVWAAYTTSYSVRFEGGLKDVLWLSMFLTLSHPLMSVVIMLFLILGAALALMVPFLALFLPACVCLLISFPMETVYRRHMHPEDLEKAKAGE